MSQGNQPKKDVLTPGAGHNSLLVESKGGNGLQAMLAKAKNTNASNAEEKSQDIKRDASESQDTKVIPAGDEELLFVLTVIPASEIKGRTFVDTKSNGREKELVNSHNVNELTKAIRRRNQMMPAYGVRHPDGRIEILDGQRRSLACYEAEKDFYIYVCDRELDVKLKRELAKELQTAKEISLYDMGIEVNFHRFNSGDDGVELTGKQIAVIMGISESAVSRANKAFRTPMPILKCFYDYNILQVTDYVAINKFVSAFERKVKISALNNLDKFVNSNRTKAHNAFKDRLDKSTTPTSLLVEHLRNSYSIDDELPMYEVLFSLMFLEFFANKPEVIDDSLDASFQDDDSKVTVAELHSLQSNYLVKGCKSLSSELEKREKNKGVKKTDFIEEAGAKEWNSSSSSRRFKLTGSFKIDPKTSNTAAPKGKGSIDMSNVPPEVYEKVSKAVQEILVSHVKASQTK